MSQFRIAVIGSVTRQYWVYILANRSHRLYVGVTNDLETRTWRHQQGDVGFTSKYRINRLVYFEAYEHIVTAIQRETELRGWLRSKKIERWNSRSFASLRMTERPRVGA